MSYAQVSDMELRYPGRDLIQLTNEVTPLMMTFSGSPGTITLPFGNLTPILYVQSAPTPLPTPQTTYVLTSDYTVDATAGVITRNASGQIPADGTVYVSADDGNYLQTFLSDASVEIDSYLETRFALPLSDIPAVLVRICCEIAMYHLQGLRPIHDLAYIKDIYEKDIAFLMRVKNGELSLGLTLNLLEPATPTNPAVVQVDAGGTAPSYVLPRRVFSRGSLIGY